MIKKWLANLGSYLVNTYGENTVHTSSSIQRNYKDSRRERAIAAWNRVEAQTYLSTQIKKRFPNSTQTKE